ncbi:MAG TPA: potassium channel family protein [Solirubrobacterales bacterium]|nr:potassium channel family protein [Solirubrobacterales bacterium]
MDARSEAIQQRFEWPVIAAALLTIPLVLIQESHLPQPWPTVGEVLNWGTWLVFATEVVVMLWVAPRKWVWARSHVIDIVVTILTPPFAPAAWQAGRVYRVARLLRLLRVFSLRRMLTFDGIKLAALAAVATVVLGGIAVASIESTPQEPWTAWDGIWWAVTTVTTVGYGGLEPETDSGRIIASAIMLVGIGFVALVTAFIADRFVASQKETEDQILTELREIRARLERLEAR